jgi:large subunit ribosomal protein L35
VRLQSLEFARLAEFAPSEDGICYKTKGLAMPRNASKPKRKLKTHRGAAKRFKLTATGKLLRMHSGKRHLLGTKAAKRMRKLKKITQVNPADKAKTLQMLPYGLS